MAHGLRHSRQPASLGWRASGSGFSLATGMAVASLRCFIISPDATPAKCGAAAAGGNGFRSGSAVRRFPTEPPRQPATVVKRRPTLRAPADTCDGAPENPRPRTARHRFRRQHGQHNSGQSATCHSLQECRAHKSVGIIRTGGHAARASSPGLLRYSFANAQCRGRDRRDAGNTV